MGDSPLSTSPDILEGISDFKATQLFRILRLYKYKVPAKCVDELYHNPTIESLNKICNCLMKAYSHTSANYQGKNVAALLMQKVYQKLLLGVAIGQIDGAELKKIANDFYEI